MAGTSDIELDLHIAIDRLLLLKADLQAYCGAARERNDVRRNQIAFAIRQVSERALALEDVVMRIGAPVVVVTAKRAAAESLRCAVHRMDRLESIDDSQPFDELVSCIVDALHAADVVGLRAAGGRPEVAVDHVVHVERLARTDGARTGIAVARIGPPPPVCVADEPAARSVGR
jgi:hypothetical protein